MLGNHIDEFLAWIWTSSQLENIQPSLQDPADDERCTIPALGQLFRHKWRPSQLFGSVGKSLKHLS